MVHKSTTLECRENETYIFTPLGSGLEHSCHFKYGIFFFYFYLFFKLNAEESNEILDLLKSAGL